MTNTTEKPHIRLALIRAEEDRTVPRNDRHIRYESVKAMLWLNTATAAEFDEAVRVYLEVIDAKG